MGIHLDCHNEETYKHLLIKCGVCQEQDKEDWSSSDFWKCTECVKKFMDAAPLVGERLGIVMANADFGGPPTDWEKWSLLKEDRVKYEKINIQTKEQHIKYLAEVEELIDLDPKKETIEGQRLDILANKVEDYEKLNFT